MIAPARRRSQPETGSVTVLAGGILLLSGVLVLASVDLMRAVQGRARAQVAADAAALAAAQEIALPSGRSPAEVAADYASKNGATLLSCRCEPGTGEAIVEVEAPVTLVFVGPDRTVRASARAVIEGAGERDPGRPGTMARDAGPGTQRQRAP
jgi:secretion/DNA translocation related TadE-like protein